MYAIISFYGIFYFKGMMDILKKDKILLEYFKNLIKSLLPY